MQNVGFPQSTSPIFCGVVMFSFCVFTFLVSPIKERLCCGESIFQKFLLLEQSLSITDNHFKKEAKCLCQSQRNFSVELCAEGKRNSPKTEVGTFTGWNETLFD